MCPEEDRSLAVLRVVLTGRANGGYAEGFIVPHGTNFPSEKDEISQTRVEPLVCTELEGVCYKKSFSSFSLYKFYYCFNTMNIFMYFIFIKLFKYISIQTFTNPYELPDAWGK